MDEEGFSVPVLLCAVLVSAILLVVILNWRTQVLNKACNVYADKGYTICEIKTNLWPTTDRYALTDAAIADYKSGKEWIAAIDVESGFVVKINTNRISIFNIRNSSESTEL